jgi:hypothetical protein
MDAPIAGSQEASQNLEGQQRSTGPFLQAVEQCPLFAHSCRPESK